MNIGLCLMKIVEPQIILQDVWFLHDTAFTQRIPFDKYILLVKFCLLFLKKVIYFVQRDNLIHVMKYMYRLYSITVSRKYPHKF